MLLNVSVLRHVYYELIYLLLGASSNDISGEVPFLDEFLNRVISRGIIPFVLGLPALRRLHTRSLRFALVRSNLTFLSAVSGVRRLKPMA